MATMTSLSVNVNRVALLRNTRDVGLPNVVHAARICLDAGAAGITVHPRPDQRHIKPQDVRDIATILRKYPLAEFNIEGNPFHRYMDLVKEVRPTQCTLVPDEPEAATSNHGWNLTGPTVRRLTPIVKKLTELGCRVSLFMDPDPKQIERAAKLGVQRIELYTEPYAAAFAARQRSAANPYAAAARIARDLGLGVNAGHDLNLKNLPPLVRKIPFLAEVSIGHALIADALEFGLAETVRKYRSALRLVRK
jgi:pyridoxine 5-phosphate synthase